MQSSLTTTQRSDTWVVFFFFFFSLAADALALGLLGDAQGGHPELRSQSYLPGPDSFFFSSLAILCSVLLSFCTSHSLLEKFGGCTLAMHLVNDKQGPSIAYGLG